VRVLAIGCWVDRSVVNGLLVFVGAVSSVAVVMVLLFSTLACFCSINVKKFLCCPIM